MRSNIEILVDPSLVTIVMVMTLLLLQELRTASLARVVCDCMDDVDKLQPFLFLQPDTIANIRTRWGNIIDRSNNNDISLPPAAAVRVSPALTWSSGGRTPGCGPSSSQHPTYTPSSGGTPQTVQLNTLMTQLLWCLIYLGSFPLFKNLRWQKDDVWF